MKGGCLNWAVQTNRESVSWIKVHVAKCSKGGHMAVDLWAGTFSVTKACMKLPIQPLLVGCEIDAVCFNASVSSIIETFAGRVVNED